MSRKKTERCECGHTEGKHRPKTARLSAYCDACRGAKALHPYRAGVAA